MKLGTLKHKGKMGLSLAPLQSSDARELFALTEASREHLRTWLPWVDATRSPRDSLRFIRFALKQHAAGKGAHLAIRRRREIAGVIGFCYVDWNSRKAELGYWLGAKHLGRGLATRSCRALVDAAFSRLKLNRVEIRVDPKNAKSLAVPERLGFRAEGVLREAHRLHGRYCDLAMYAMLRRDWKRGPI